ncbi:hypothetical protein D0838_10850 [Bordetella avium]|nr:hypothetical protein D0843_11830 [Bordetella avium]RIQ71191.1 hypothetical protein D0838_10850 [Bordetella avium]
MFSIGASSRCTGGTISTAGKPGLSAGGATGGGGTTFGGGALGASAGGGAACGTSGGSARAALFTLLSPPPPPPPPQAVRTEHDRTTAACRKEVVDLFLVERECMRVFR